jgi:hypothetical protein
MDLGRPIRAVVPSLDGPVLEVLAGTSRPLTIFEVQRLAGVGSPSGIRKVLERLTREGVVEVDRRANAAYYAANREHLAWPAVEILVGLRSALFRLLASEIHSFAVPPVHASLFGSAARADGEAESDIDVLLVKPTLDDVAEEAWASQLDTLRARVLTRTGNRCQAFDLSLSRLAEHVGADDALLRSWLTDGVLLFGQPLSDLVDQAKAVVA